MSFQVFVNRCRTAVFSFSLIALTLVSALAQVSSIPGSERRPMSVAEKNNLYCAGYVQKAPIDTANRLVGAVGEADRFNFTQPDFVWLNAGANKGVKVGDVWSVVRPKGQVQTKWTKKGSLGFLVEEVGAVEVVRVKADVSVARVTTSCEGLLLGDLVQPFQVRTSPIFTERPAMDLFADPTGKASGRVFMTRDGREMVTKEHTVYVDLGAEDNVKTGDYLTVFRPIEDGNILFGPDESVNARSYGYESLTYKGGKFSNQSARKSGNEARGHVVTSGKAKAGRPELRKIVGEMVILNVKERTATALITRSYYEIHTGDWVEVQ